MAVVSEEANRTMLTSLQRTELGRDDREYGSKSVIRVAPRSGSNICNVYFSLVRAVVVGQWVYRK